MADGTTRKLDYAFGDIFEKEKKTEDLSVLNKIVFIGKKKSLVDSGKYFMINRARQYGKTTTLKMLGHYLKR